MIAADTSVWVDFFRGRQPVANKLVDLLDRDLVCLPVPVRIEILGGARKDRQQRLGRILTALPLLLPTEATWIKIEAWVTAGAAVGQRFGVGDLLVGAIAAEQGYEVWSLDADFRRMANLGFVALAAP